MFKLILVTLGVCALRVNTMLLPYGQSDLESRATAPACTGNSNIAVNGGFYGYPNPPSYTPWTVTATGGQAGCKYLNDYTVCLALNTFGGGDPNCFACEYGTAGGSTTISQQVNFVPGCLYTIEATVACWSHNDLYQGHNSADYGTPHVFFRVLLDHTTVIPQQLSCPACTSSNQPGCSAYPSPTYQVVRGNITAPASGSGTLKVLVSQISQNKSVSPFMLTALRMITPGTDQFH
ncbi:MAG: hypothetical protein Q9228_006688 [Teloschistes exilis]